VCTLTVSVCPDCERLSARRLEGHPALMGVPPLDARPAVGFSTPHFLLCLGANQSTWDEAGERAERGRSDAWGNWRHTHWESDTHSFLPWHHTHSLTHLLHHSRTAHGFVSSGGSSTQARDSHAASSPASCDACVMCVVPGAEASWGRQGERGGR